MSRTTANSSSLMPRMMLAVDERLCRRIAQLELDAAILLQHLDVEIRILLEHRARIVADVARRSARRARSGAASSCRPRAAGVAQARHFVAREDIQAADRRDARADGRPICRATADGVIHSILLHDCVGAAAAALPRTRRSA